MRDPGLESLLTEEKKVCPDHMVESVRSSVIIYHTMKIS